MISLLREDKRHILESLPKDIKAMMQEHDVVLAGGFIRAKISGEPVTDIDLFCPSAEKAGFRSRELASARSVRDFRTKNAYTILAPPRLPVQFIHRWTYDSAESLLQSFDFTVAQAALWFDKESATWKSMACDRFYPDLAAKRLVYTFPVRHEDAGGSLLRMQKFLGRGYRISPENMAKVITRLLGGVRENTGFWQGGEEARAKVLTGFLRQVDPLTVIDGLEPSEDSLEEAPVT